MDKHRGNVSIAMCCATLGVRREGYYAWKKRPRQRELRDAEMVSALKEIREKHPCYGVGSMIDELPEDKKVSYGKGYVLCRDNGLLQKRRKPNSLTKQDRTKRTSDDLIKRDFKATVPGSKLLTDITEIKGCKDGKLYLCGVLDCFDGALVGLSMDTNMRAPLCTSAVLGAISRYGKAEGAVIHSDRGSQFTSNLFKETMLAKGIRQSMGKTGCCYDNARMESFFATLKKELIYRLPLYKMTRAEAKHRIFEWIESYYNRMRRHTSNEHNMPPLVKRQRYFSGVVAA